jgi:predicted transcriptional regulator
MPSLEHAMVADAMHPGILTTNPDTPMTEVARMMASHHVHSIVVIGGADDAPTWGIVTDIDILRVATQSGVEPNAEALSVRPAVTVETTTPLLEAAQSMIKHATAHLLVVEPISKRPIGVISTLDIAGILAWGEG